MNKNIKSEDKFTSQLILIKDSETNAMLHASSVQDFLFWKLTNILNFSLFIGSSPIFTDMSRLFLGKTQLLSFSKTYLMPLFTSPLMYDNDLTYAPVLNTYFIFGCLTDIAQGFFSTRVYTLGLGLQWAFHLI